MTYHQPVIHQPDIVANYVLNPFRGIMSFILPRERTNLVRNPSFENDVDGATGYTANGSGSIGVVFTDSFYGAASMRVTTSSVGGGIRYGSTAAYQIATTAGVTYAFSLMFKGVKGRAYRIAFGTSAGTELQGRTFRACGGWQFEYVLYTETSSASRSLMITTQFAAALSTHFFYIDGLQCEACEAAHLYPTTYIDGDQVGYPQNLTPPAYFWVGKPHDSVSFRSGKTMHGGRIVNFDATGFRILSIAGLGAAVRENVIQNYSQLDGGEYQDSLIGIRQFGLTGVWDANTIMSLQQQKAKTLESIMRDFTGVRQPVSMLYQEWDPETKMPVGNIGRLMAAYDGGFESTYASRFGQISTGNFSMPLPVIVTQERGAQISAGAASISNTSRLLYRTRNGQWTSIGAFNGTVNKITQGPDGYIYIGGNFTNGAGVTGADYMVKFNPVTLTASLVAAASTFNAQVNDMAWAPNGLLYIGGAFTNAGTANGDGIVSYDPATDLVSALGTGLSGGNCNCLCVGYRTATPIEIGRAHV